MQTHKKNGTREKAIDDKMLDLGDNDFKEAFITKALTENMILNIYNKENLSKEKRTVKK